MTKPFSEIRPGNDAFVKALYYAHGRNDAVDRINDNILSGFLKVDAIAFADAYTKHCEANTSHIAVQDCFEMFLIGKLEFGR